MHPNLIIDPQILAQYSRDPVLQGSPDYVFRGTDVKTTAEILHFANQKKIPVTFCGSQTAMTGSGVAESGIALTLNPCQKILEIGVDAKTNEAFAVCEPGILLGDLKQKVWELGLFYPPDPTSFKEATLGGTVATNATGSDTYKYGPTRLYVQELEMLDANGKTKTLRRTHPLQLSHPKNKAGYFLDGEEIDHIIGCEGTLALITKIKIKLLSNTGKNVFVIVLPFADNHTALKAVCQITNSAQKPRALEWIGPGAAAYFQAAPTCPQELKRENCFLYLKDEYVDDGDLQKKIDAWFRLLKNIYTDLHELEAFERIFVATTQKQQDDLHAARHHIPLKVNEEYFPFTKVGGGKIGTDWWVPIEHLEAMIAQTLKESQDAKISFLLFGHIGNGHPHVDYLCRNADEYARAQNLVKRQCQRAVRYGGGVAGEHGIGKLKRDLLRIQHSDTVIQSMRALKQKWDPNWILGRGNLFLFE